MTTYTYTIFDADPNSSSGTEWPSHTDVTLEADSDDEAVEAVREVMSVESAGLNPSDGYDVGESVHAIVWADDGTIVGMPTYELTADDLGIDDETETDDERIARAVKHISAVELADGDYAYYADETSTYWVVGADELAELCDYLDDEDEPISGDAYSHWCAGTSAREMPRGWEPNQTGDDEVVACECGQCTGDRCAWTGPRRETVVVEYMPEYLRASHEAAGNRGLYPCNGAIRIRCERSCADRLTHVWVDGEQTSELDQWVEIVGE